LALGPSQPPVQWGPGLFSGGNVAAKWRLSPTPSSAEVRERVELYLYSPPPLWAFVACSRVTCTFSFLVIIFDVTSERSLWFLVYILVMYVVGLLVVVVVVVVVVIMLFTFV
jgi:hypothetical protein